MTQDEFEQKKATLIAYLKLKLDEQDCHGIRDCCVDIEVLQAQMLGELK